MSSLVPKIALGCIGSSGIIAGAIYASLPEKYSHHFEKQDRKLIIDFSEEKWNAIKKVYGAEGEGLLIEPEGKALTKDQWQSWCSNNSNNTFADAKDAKYQRVSAWCTEPKKISDLVGDKALDDKEPQSSSKHSQEGEWNKKITNYAQITDNKQLIKEITADNSAKKERGEIAATALKDASKLRAWCAFTKEQHFKHEEDQPYKNYLLWCTK